MENQRFSEEDYNLIMKDINRVLEIFYKEKSEDYFIKEIRHTKNYYKIIYKEESWCDDDLDEEFIIPQEILFNKQKEKTYFKNGDLIQQMIWCEENIIKYKEDLKSLNENLITIENGFRLKDQMYESKKEVKTYIKMYEKDIKEEELKKKKLETKYELLMKGV